MGLRVPRVLIAGLSGDSGKTIASLSLLTALRQRRLAISVFKKGPDYIDAAWLGHVAGSPCRNLDTYMVKPPDVVSRFARHATEADMALVEGNRGLFDGKDVRGTHSSAALAKLLGIPVVLVVDATKATRTLAALVKGCQLFDPDVNIAGVILNRVGGQRHVGVACGAIEEYCGVPVLGTIPKLGSDESIIPGRHLGLVTPAEFDGFDALQVKLGGIAAEHLDIDGLLRVADTAKELELPEIEATAERVTDARVAYFRDSVFTFYYPENLEALEAQGAVLVPVDSLRDRVLPADVDALYIGGGFPETQASRLSENRSLMRSIKAAADKGFPIYAECGGLIYLCRSLACGGERYEMAGVFPVDLAMQSKPAGHGYTEVRVDKPNPFLGIGARIMGHEFHYSALSSEPRPGTCLQVRNGVGLGGERDGLLYRNCLAAYTHLHADGVDGWACDMVKAARRRAARRAREAADIDESNAKLMQGEVGISPA